MNIRRRCFGNCVLNNRSPSDDELRGEYEKGITTPSLRGIWSMTVAMNNIFYHLNHITLPDIPWSLIYLMIRKKKIIRKIHRL